MYERLARSNSIASRLRKRLTYANIMATIAVFLSLGGGGIAVASHLTVRSSDIVNGQVKAPDLAPGVVTRAFGTFNDGPVATTDAPANLLSLSLPRGTYVILGKLTAVYDQVEYKCSLVAGGDFDEAEPVIADPDTTFGRETLTMTVLHTSTTPFTAAIQCPDNQSGKAYNQRDLKLTAIKVTGP